MNKKIFTIVKKFTEKKDNPLHAYVYFLDKPETYIATDGHEMLMWHEDFVRPVKPDILSLKPDMSKFEAYLKADVREVLPDDEKMPFDFLFDRIVDMDWHELEMPQRTYSTLSKYLPNGEGIADKTVCSLMFLESKGIKFNTVYYLKNKYAGEFLLFSNSHFLFIAGIGIED